MKKIRLLKELYYIINDLILIKVNRITNNGKQRVELTANSHWLSKIN
ncbi:hypothetical protein KD050_21090 [Psychrobacillus sp. INOP01]|nr:hypothetical protein [Psychrobacillus sp. INOP01]QUG41715.1 hypothetical protein KD050_21090 [Psychrobacillus sp. INOP01]